jgi:hypothetical protein
MTFDSLDDPPETPMRTPRDAALLDDVHRLRFPRPNLGDSSTIDARLLTTSAGVS